MTSTLIAFNGRKTWTLWKAEEKQLFEHKMAAFRKIRGIHIMDKWYMKTSEQLAIWQDTIVQKVHERQQEWLRHVVWMDKNRIANTALQGGAEGTANDKIWRYARHASTSGNCTAKKSIYIYIFSFKFSWKEQQTLARHWAVRSVNR